MTNLKHIEWHGGSSAHARQQAVRSQRSLVEASLLRCGAVERPRWDERTRTAYAAKTR